MRKKGNVTYYYMDLFQLDQSHLLPWHVQILEKERGSLSQVQICWSITKYKAATCKHYHICTERSQLFF